MNLQDITRLSENEARELLEEIRWPDGRVCPHCSHTERTYPIQCETARPGLYECGDCGKQFTVTVGTVMHRSHIPLSKWVMAFYIICAHKKGVSARQLQRDLGLGSYRTAWHMTHRIRLAMKEEPMASLLGGQVEVDETYVGGKPRSGNNEVRKPGRGTKKASVVAPVERGDGGRVCAKPIERVNAKTLKDAVRECVDRSAMILTDEWTAYEGLGKEFRGGHFTVNHGDANMNEAGRM